MVKRTEKDHGKELGHTGGICITLDFIVALNVVVIKFKSGCCRSSGWLSLGRFFNDRLFLLFGGSFVFCTLIPALLWDGLRLGSRGGEAGELDVGKQHVIWKRPAVQTYSTTRNEFRCEWIHVCVLALQRQ
jgi:hypothetical protein